METNPLKIQVKQTVFAIDGNCVTICRSDQPMLKMPLQDIIKFADLAASQNIISVSHDEIPADGLEKGLPLIGRDKLILPPIGPAYHNSPSESGVLGAKMKQPTNSLSNYVTASGWECRTKCVAKTHSSQPASLLHRLLRFFRVVV